MDEQWYFGQCLVERIREEADDCKTLPQLVDVVTRGLQQMVALEPDKARRHLLLDKLGREFIPAVNLQVSLNRSDDGVGRPMGRA